jgi:hypothetical protein
MLKEEFAARGHLSVVVVDKFLGFVTNVESPPMKQYTYDGATRFRTRIENGVVCLPKPGQLCYRNLQRYLETIEAIKDDLKNFRIRTKEYCLLVMAEIDRQEVNYISMVGKEISINHGLFWMRQCDYEDEMSETCFSKRVYVCDYKPDPVVEEVIKCIEVIDAPIVNLEPIFEVGEVSISDNTEELSHVSCGLFHLSRIDHTPIVYRYRLNQSLLALKPSKSVYPYTQCKQVKKIDGTGVFGCKLCMEAVEENPGPLYTKKRNGSVVAHVNLPERVIPQGDSVVDIFYPPIKELFFDKDNTDPLSNVVFDYTSGYFIIGISIFPTDDEKILIHNGAVESKYSVIVGVQNSIKYATKSIEVLHARFPHHKGTVVIRGTATIKSVANFPQDKTRGPRKNKKIINVYSCEGEDDEERVVRDIKGDGDKTVEKKKIIKEDQVSRVLRNLEEGVKPKSRPWSEDTTDRIESESKIKPDKKKKRKKNKNKANKVKMSSVQLPQKTNWPNNWDWVTPEETKDREKKVRDEYFKEKYGARYAPEEK